MIFIDWAVTNSDHHVQCSQNSDDHLTESGKKPFGLVKISFGPVKIWLFSTICLIIL